MIAWVVDRLPRSGPGNQATIIRGCFSQSRAAQRRFQVLPLDVLETSNELGCKMGLVDPTHLNLWVLLLYAGLLEITYSRDV